jgi:1,4-dihydroxy-2-naphthoate octaprenyltransferase
LSELALFIRLSRPQFLLGGFLLYGLGGAIARFLGHQVDAGTYIAGQILVTLIQLMTHYLNEYYDAEGDSYNERRTFFTGGSGTTGPGGLPRRTALYAAIISLGLAATTVSAVLISGDFSLIAGLVLLLGFLGSFFYNAPPLRLITSGFGELASALIVSSLVPTFSFVLQTGELHRLLLMTTAPLIALNFAMVIAFQIPDFASDSKTGKRTLMVRLGWRSAMNLHNVAILFALLSLALAYFFGLPRRVALGSLIAVPLGAAQIWQIRRIRQGYPARYPTLVYSSVALFVITAYLELAGYLMS